jgi:hypothetical protein
MKYNVSSKVSGGELTLGFEWQLRVEPFGSRAIGRMTDIGATLPLAVA